MKEKKIQGCVYCVHNLLNEKEYIGQHHNILTVERRWNEHLQSAKRGSRYSFHCALRKYRHEGFSWDILWRGPAEKLNEKEQYYINKRHSFIDDLLGMRGYNLTTGGDTCKKSAATIRRHRKSAQAWAAAHPEAIAEVNARPEVRAARAEAGRAMWAKPGNAEDHNKCMRKYWAVPGNRERQSDLLRKYWTDPVVKAEASKCSRKRWKQPGACKRQSVLSKALWADSNYCAVQHAHRKATWSQPIMREGVSTRSKNVWASKTPKERAAWAKAISEGKRAAKRKRRKAAMSAQ